MLLGCAVAAAGTAWLWLAGASPAIPHGAGGVHGFLAAVVMWQAMVVAMMTPTVLPWVRAYARLVGDPAGRAPWPALAAFVGGYFVVWLGYSLVAAAAQVSLHDAGWLVDDRAAAPVAGGILVAAGLSQFLPLKQACLSHCRNPLTYFLARWRDGPTGGFRMGATHGAYCLGCCWLLMLSGFSMGLMNLAWMAVLTIVLSVEQVAPAGAWLGRAFGVLLAVWGLGLLI